MEFEFMLPRNTKLKKQNMVINSNDRFHRQAQAVMTRRIKALVDGMTEAKIWTDDNDNVIKSTKFQLGGLSGKKGYYRFVLTIEEVNNVENNNTFN